MNCNKRSTNGNSRPMITSIALIKLKPSGPSSLKPKKSWPLLRAGKTKLTTQCVEAIREQMLQHQQAARSAGFIRQRLIRIGGWLRYLVMPPWSEQTATFADWLETDAAEHRVFGGLLSAAAQGEAEAHANTHAALQTQKAAAERALSRAR